MTRVLRYLLPLSALLLALAPAASATDGVVLINQATAATGLPGCGTNNGFPIVICNPGSYRLAGSLAVPVGATAIVVAASRVTLDLNGFSIVASPGGNATGSAGVFADGPAGLTIDNGVIFGFDNGIMVHAGRATVRAITAEQNYQYGIFLASGLIEDCTVANAINPPVGHFEPIDVGILLSAPGTALRNLVIVPGGDPFPALAYEGSTTAVTTALNTFTNGGAILGLTLGNNNCDGTVC